MNETGVGVAMALWSKKAESSDQFDAFEQVAAQVVDVIATAGVVLDAPVSYTHLTLPTKRIV